MQLNEKHCVVIGAGVVGQLLSARLHESGCKVVVGARPHQAAALREHGIRLRGQGEASPRAITGVPAVECIEASVDAADYVFLAVRSDQLAGAISTLSAVEGLGAVPVVCCPLWRSGVALLDRRFPRWDYLLPGFNGVFEDGVVRYQPGTTRTGPLAPPDNPGNRELAELLTEAGLKARHDPGLLTFFNRSLP